MGDDLPSLGPRGEGWVAIQLLLLLTVFLLGPLGRIAVSGMLADIMAVGGLSLLAAGAGLLLWGSVGLGSNLTPMPRPQEGSTLVDSGAYRLVRHPLYGGLLLAALGWSVSWLSPLGLFATAALFIFFGLKSRREEAWLRDYFEGYAAYAARTRRFIPWIY